MVDKGRRHGCYHRQLQGGPTDIGCRIHVGFIARHGDEGVTHGNSSQPKTFRHLHGIMLGNHSRTVQHKSLCALEGRQVASITVENLKGLRSDEPFDLFWTKVTSQREISTWVNLRYPRELMMGKNRRIRKNTEGHPSAGIR